MTGVFFIASYRVAHDELDGFTLKPQTHIYHLNWVLSSFFHVFQFLVNKICNYISNGRKVGQFAGVLNFQHMSQITSPLYCSRMDDDGGGG